MTKLLLKSGLAGAAVLFIWGFISWMVLPWHNKTMSPWSNEGAVSQAVMDSAPTSGIYVLPDPHKHDDTATQEKLRTGPFMFAAVTRQGMDGGMGKQLAGSFLIQFLGVVLASWLLLKANLAAYKQRVLFLLVTVLVGGVVSHLPYWNWWGFPSGYTVVQLLDLAVGWLLAGLVIAKILKA